MTKIGKSNPDKRHNAKTKCVNVLRDTTNLQIVNESKMPRKTTRNNTKGDVNTLSVAARKTRKKNSEEPEALTAVDEKLKSPCTVRVTRLRGRAPHQKVNDEKLKSPCTVRVARMQSHIKGTKSKVITPDLKKGKIQRSKQTGYNKKKNTDIENGVEIIDEKLNSPCVVNVTRLSKKNSNTKKNLRTHAEAVENKHVYDKENSSESSNIHLSPKTSNKNVSLRRTKLFENRNQQSTSLKKGIENSNSCNQCCNGEDAVSTKENNIQTKMPVVILKKAETVTKFLSSGNKILNAEQVNLPEKEENSHKNMGESKFFRKRQPVKYADSSLDSTDPSIHLPTENTKHVPVYRQQAVDPESKIKLKYRPDVYEFFAEPSKKHKKKTRISDASFVFKERKRPKKITWQKKVKDTLTKLGLNIESDNLEQDLLKLIKSKEQESLMRKDVNVSNDKQVVNNLMPQQNNVANKKQIVNNLTPQQNNVANKKQVVNNLTLKQDIVSTQKQVVGNDTCQTIVQNLSTEDNVNDNDPFFGFSDDDDDDDDSPKKVNPPKRINIISQTVMKPSQQVIAKAMNSKPITESPIHFPSRPNANSTMLNPDTSHNPWRSSIPMKRNPHFLSVKGNSLPSVDQEMVLNASVVENCERNATHHFEATTKKPSQRSILQFVSGSNCSENVINHEMSLFDADKYSPIKTKNDTNQIQTDDHQNKTQDDKQKQIPVVSPKENQGGESVKIDNENVVDSVTNHSNELDKNHSLITDKENAKVTKPVDDKLKKAKRRLLNSTAVTDENKIVNYMHVINKKTEKRSVLGDKIGNAANIQRNSSFGISNYFGFDSFDESISKIQHEPETKTKNVEDNTKNTANKVKIDINPDKPKPTKNMPVVFLVNIIKQVNDKDIFFIKQFENFNKSSSGEVKKYVSDQGDNEVQEIPPTTDSPVPLFQDLKPMPRKQYVKRSKKKVHYQDIPSDDESDLVCGKKKKKKKKPNQKDVHWDDEAENWAKSFNSMCQEIDDYELDVE